MPNKRESHLPYPTQCENPGCRKVFTLMSEPLTAYWLKKHRHLCHECYHKAWDTKKLIDQKKDAKEVTE